MAKENKKAKARSRASELLGTHNLQMGAEGKTYKLIGKDSGEVNKDALIGLDVNAGLFSRNRRENKLIGRELVRQNNSNKYSNSATPTSPSIAPSDVGTPAAQPGATKTPAPTGTADNTTLQAKPAATATQSYPSSNSYKGTSLGENSLSNASVKLQPIPDSSSSGAIGSGINLGVNPGIQPQLDPFPKPAGYPDTYKPPGAGGGVTPGAQATETTGPDYNKIFGYDLKNYNEGISEQIKKQIGISSRETGTDIMGQIEGTYGNTDTQALMQWYDRSYPNMLGSMAGRVKGTVDKYGTHKPGIEQTDPILRYFKGLRENKTSYKPYKAAKLHPKQQELIDRGVRMR